MGKKTTKESCNCVKKMKRMNKKYLKQFFAAIELIEERLDLIEKFLGGVKSMREVVEKK